MRIGILTTFLALPGDADSGIGQHYRILADALAELGHKVHVVYATLSAERAEAALCELSPAWTWTVVPVKSPGWLDRAVMRSWPSRLLLNQVVAAWEANRQLHHVATKLDLQVIETHATSFPALFYLMRRRRPPVVTRVSTSLSQMNEASLVHSRVYRWLVAIERWTVNSSDAIVTHTTRHRDAVCTVDGYSPDRFVIIPHGIHDAVVVPDGRVDPDDLIRILFVGRFENRKGIDVLLKSIPIIIAKFPNVRFTLAGATGNGDEWAAFQIEQAALMPRWVVAPGRVSEEELTRLYSTCDIFVAPSRYESFGLIYVEAMRFEKPVVGCRTGGVPEVVEDEVTGLLANPGDLASLVGCLSRLIDDPALRRRLGRAGRQVFLERFSATRMAEASVELYRKLGEPSADAC